MTEAPNQTHEPAPDPADEPMMRWFVYDHLPPGLRDVSQAYAELAEKTARHLPRSPERTVALRKLLEAKDAAVRCALAVRWEQLHPSQ